MGVEPETFEVITDDRKSTRILVDLAKSVKEEALFLLPADKSMIRVDRLGVIDYLIEASQNSSVITVMDVLLIVRVRVQRRKMPPLWISDRKVQS